MAQQKKNFAVDPNGRILYFDAETAALVGLNEYRSNKNR